MSDLDELRRVLTAREALAPAPDGIAAAARAQGVRIRRTRIAATVAGGAVAVVAVVALAAGVVGLPGASRPPGVPGVTATPTGPVVGGWPAVPGYTGPAVPGAPGVPGPTQLPTAPVSGRAIDPVVPYQVTLPEGWREFDWWYEEGSFRGTWAGPDRSVDLAVINVLDPATQPASLLRPSGDPATGSPGEDGTLAWRPDARHFVRIQLQNDPPGEVLRSIVGSLRFTERPMIVPYHLDHVPAGLHLSGVKVSLSTPEDDADGGRPWDTRLTFDYGVGPARAGHDLVIGIGGNPDPSSQPPVRNPTTVAGRTASVQRLDVEKATLIQVFGVDGHNPYFIVGDPAQDRISLAEVERVLAGLRFVGRPENTSTWVPLRLP